MQASNETVLEQITELQETNRRLKLTKGLCNYVLMKGPGHRFTDHSAQLSSGSMLVQRQHVLVEGTLREIDRKVNIGMI